MIIRLTFLLCLAASTACTNSKATPNSGGQIHATSTSTSTSHSTQNIQLKDRSVVISDLLQWGPPWAQGSLLISELHGTRALVDALGKKFPDVPAIQMAVKSLRESRFGTIALLSDDWGGIDPTRGLALYLADQGRMRVVFGAHQLTKALETLAQLLSSEFNIESTASGNRLRIKSGELDCAIHGGLAVCDTRAVPEKPENALSYTAPGNLANTLMWGYLPGQLFGRKFKKLPFSGVSIELRETAEECRLTVDLPFSPAGQQVGVMLGNTGIAGYPNVNAGQGFLGLQLPGPLLNMVTLKAGNARPPIGPIAKTLGAHWSGGLSLTTDGGLYNLVASIGLRSEEGGVAIAQVLADAISGLVCKSDCSRIEPSSSVAGAKILRVRIAKGKEQVITFDLHHAVVRNELILALSPADLKRRLNGEVVAGERPKSTHPVFLEFGIGNPFVLVGTPWVRTVLDSGSLSDLITLYGAQSAQYDSLNLSIGSHQAGLRAVVRMRRLPGNGPGAEAYKKNIKLALTGDALNAHKGWIKLAAAHPNTIYGRMAENHLSSFSSLAIPAIGILAAVAIPAFMKYVQRSKNREAVMNIRKIFDGSIVYYEQGRTDASGQPLPKRFPASAPLTPGNPTKFMCKNGQSKKYVPNAETWSHPTWQKLNFQVQDPFYYAYEYEAEYVEGGKTAFTARALGDLNCDGIHSTFERIGVIDENGNISGGAGIFTKNELE